MSVFVFHVVGMLARTMDREGRLLTIRFEADAAGVGCLLLGAVLSLRADIPAPIVWIWMRIVRVPTEPQRRVSGTIVAAAALISSTISLRTSKNSPWRTAEEPKQSTPVLKMGTHQQPTSTGSM